MKATELVKFLKEEFDLGHGHSMALWAVFKKEGWVSLK
jgi:transposase